MERQELACPCRWRQAQRLLHTTRKGTPPGAVPRVCALYHRTI